jgi:hypothetical protein
MIRHVLRLQLSGKKNKSCPCKRIVQGLRELEITLVYEKAPFEGCGESLGDTGRLLWKQKHGVERSWGQARQGLARVRDRVGNFGDDTTS